MKKTMKILSILALLAVVVIAVTPALADENAPPTTGDGEQKTPVRSQISELIVAAFSAETQLTVEEILVYKESGLNLVQIAQDLGYQGEELTALMETVSSAALEQAVIEGIISQEKAELITNRESQFQVGVIFTKFLETLAITKEELAAKLESGMTLHEIALEQGMEFGGHLANRCGKTREEIITAVNGGKTLKELCPGIMMPEGGWPKENLFRR